MRTPLAAATPTSYFRKNFTFTGDPGAHRTPPRSYRGRWRGLLSERPGNLPHQPSRGNGGSCHLRAVQYSATRGQRFQAIPRGPWSRERTCSPSRSTRPRRTPARFFPPGWKPPRIRPIRRRSRLAVERNRGYHRSRVFHRTPQHRHRCALDHRLHALHFGRGRLRAARVVLSRRRCCQLHRSAARIPSGWRATRSFSMLPTDDRRCPGGRRHARWPQRCVSRPMAPRLGAAHPVRANQFALVTDIVINEICYKAPDLAAVSGTPPVTVIHLRCFPTAAPGATTKPGRALPPAGRPRPTRWAAAGCPARAPGYPRPTPLPLTIGTPLIAGF